ncbi:MAG: MarR family transcriptional regulator [SAR202 cluster bacterium]|nr:MarR family transcriptional regulator [SAR202 cluster bacterium]
MPAKKPNRRLSAWQTFLQTHALVVRKLEREMEDLQGTPLTWYDVLLHLKNAPGGRLRMQTLARHVVLTRSGLTRLIDRMEAHGQVRREDCPEDRRGSFAVITPLGLQVQKNCATLHLRGIRNHFTRHLSNSDLDALHAILSKVLKANKA